MRDFKCVACKIRTRRAGDSADVVGEACSGCGFPLERVGALSEVVGFRLITADDVAPAGDYAQRVSAALDLSYGRTPDAL